MSEAEANPQPTTHNPQPILSFDMGGTKLAAALVRGAQVLERRQRPTPEDRSPDAMVQAFLELGADWFDVVSHVAVAATGHVDPRDRRVSALNYDTLPWFDVPLTEKLERASGKRAYVLNDADAAAWGEFRYGAGQGSRRMLFVTVSTGVGSGLVLDGKLLEGSELGFTLLRRNTPLEWEVSGKALDDYAHSLGWQDAREALEHLSEHTGLQRRLERMARQLVRKLVDISMMLSLDRMVIGGGLGLNPVFFAVLEPEFHKLDYYGKGLEGKVSLAQLGADAGLIGAADWARSRL